MTSTRLDPRTLQDAARALRAIEAAGLREELQDELLAYRSSHRIELQDRAFIGNVKNDLLADDLSRTLEQPRDACRAAVAAEFTESWPHLVAKYVVEFSSRIRRSRNGVRLEPRKCKR